MKDTRHVDVPIPFSFENGERPSFLLLIVSVAVKERGHRDHASRSWGLLERLPVV